VGGWGGGEGGEGGVIVRRLCVTAVCVCVCLCVYGGGTCVSSKAIGVFAS